MNRLNNLFNSKRNLLSVYFTAGYPSADDTMPILQRLDAAGADFVEIGMPFSDPLADGPVLQQSALRALENGMTVRRLFQQIADMRQSITMPVVLMGYINPVMLYGMEDFLASCSNVGVSALILPDLPFDMYLSHYKSLFDKYQIGFVPLIAPQCSDERIRFIDANCNSFIYVVSSRGITGNICMDVHRQQSYYQRISSLSLKHPVMVGFGITTADDFRHACRYANGAITGTAFVKHIEQHGTTEASIASFVRKYKTLSC